MRKYLYFLILVFCNLKCKNNSNRILRFQEVKSYIFSTYNIQIPQDTIIILGSNKCINCARSVASIFETSSSNSNFFYIITADPLKVDLQHFDDDNLNNKLTIDNIIQSEEDFIQKPGIIVYRGNKFDHYIEWNAENLIKFQPKNWLEMFDTTSVE